MSRRAVESPIGRLVGDGARERSALVMESPGCGKSADRLGARAQKVDPTRLGKGSSGPGLAGDPRPPAAHSAQIRRLMRTKHVGTQIDYL